MEKNQYLSVSQLAQILNISRVAVLKKINKGQIEATKVGRNFIIPKDQLGEILSDALSPHTKELIEKAVKRTVKEYGETLKLLGQE